MSNKVWNNNKIQFPRLIAELHMIGAFNEQVLSDLSESMDLSPEQIDELVDRALVEFENNKIKVLKI